MIPLKKILNRIFYIYRIYETEENVVLQKRSIRTGKWKDFLFSKFQDDVELWKEKYGADYDK